ncbi:MAG TPA: hypothetical protein VJT33_05145 [bacterium]|nr:hypothetical protein [bacterium]
MAIGNLEIRMAHLAGANEQINRRLGTIAQDVRGLRAEMAGMPRNLTGRMGRQFFWTLGPLIVSVLLPIVRSTGH